MTRKLISTHKFERAYIRFIKKAPFLQKSIDKAIQTLQDDAFSSQLQTHKLSGNLYGLFSCSCGYDCRIVFSIEKDKTNNIEHIILIDIGTHDEIY